MYQTLFDLINQFCYNGDAVLGTIHYDVATLVATIGVVVVVAFPFYVVMNAVKFFTGGFR